MPPVKGSFRIGLTVSWKWPNVSARSGRVAFFRAGRRLGLRVHGFNAADVPLAAAAATYLREALARVKAVLDVTVLGTQPRHGGPPVEILL